MFPLPICQIYLICILGKIIWKGFEGCPSKAKKAHFPEKDKALHQWHQTPGTGIFVISRDEIKLEAKECAQMWSLAYLQVFEYPVPT